MELAFYFHVCNRFFLGNLILIFCFSVFFQWDHLQHHETHHENEELKKSLPQSFLLLFFLNSYNISLLLNFFFYLWLFINGTFTFSLFSLLSPLLSSVQYCLYLTLYCHIISFLCLPSNYKYNLNWFSVLQAITYLPFNISLNNKNTRYGQLTPHTGYGVILSPGKAWKKTLREYKTWMSTLIFKSKIF